MIRPNICAVNDHIHAVIHHYAVVVNSVRRAIDEAGGAHMADFFTAASRDLGAAVPGGAFPRSELCRTRRRGAGGRVRAIESGTAPLLSAHQ